MTYPKRYSLLCGAVAETKDTEGNPSGEYVRSEDYDKLSAELAALRHDLERYIAIAGEEATRAEGLRTSLEEMVDQHVNGIAGISPPCIDRALALLNKKPS